MVESAYGDDRLKRPQPFVSTFREPKTPGATPSAWSTVTSFGGDPHPDTEDRSFTSATSDRVGGNTEVLDPSKSLKTAGYGGRPWGFDLLQREQVGMYRPTGSDQ